MRLFRRHRGSQTGQGTGFIAFPGRGADPNESARDLAAAFAPPPLLDAHKQPAVPGWTTSFICGCGGGMYPCAIVAATKNSQTIRMKTNGCDHTVDVTYTVEIAASGDVE